MAGKYLVSHLPSLMKNNGIKNITELSIKTGLPQNSLHALMRGQSFDFNYDVELINRLVEFFHCKVSSLISLERQYHDYSHLLEHKERNNGVVYFLKADNGLTKIGWSGNLKPRKEQIEHAEKVKTELIHHISSYDCPTLEKTLHKVFAHKRVKGEWFDLTDEDINIFKDKSKEEAE